jgi:hypothetical protein
MLAEQGESLNLLETRESLGKFESFFNGHSAFLDQARPVKESDENCFLRRMLGISLYEAPHYNAFMDKTLPLSKLLHGIYCMTPPERLHTTSEGLTKYMIESLCKGKRLLNKIESLHHTLHFDLKRNSEHDFPRGSARNGDLKNTLVSATKRRGIMF